MKTWHTHECGRDHSGCPDSYSSHARCVEISLIRRYTLISELNALEFPMSQFVYAGRSASSGVGETLVKKAAQSEKLRVLQVGLSGFSALVSPALTELTLPCDNRIDLEKRRSEVVSTLSLLPQMHTLSIIIGSRGSGRYIGHHSLEVGKCLHSGNIVERVH